MLKTIGIWLVSISIMLSPIAANSTETLKILGQLAPAAEGASVTCTSATPMVCTWTNGGLQNGDQFFFASGTPPTGGPTWALNTIYWVVGASGNTFNLATTLGGSAAASTSTGTTLTGSAYRLLYAPASATTAVVSSIVVANNSASADTYRIAIIPSENTGSGVAAASKHFLAYGASVAPNDTQIITLGITLSAFDAIMVYDANGTSAFQSYGAEVQ